MEEDRIIEEKGAELYFGPNKYCLPLRDKMGRCWKIFVFDKSRNDTGEWFLYKFPEEHVFQESDYENVCLIAMDWFQKSMNEKEKYGC